MKKTISILVILVMVFSLGMTSVSARSQEFDPDLITEISTEEGKIFAAATDDELKSIMSDQLDYMKDILMMFFGETDPLFLFIDEDLSDEENIINLAEYISMMSETDYDPGDKTLEMVKIDFLKANIEGITGENYDIADKTLDNVLGDYWYYSIITLIDDEYDRGEKSTDEIHRDYYIISIQEADPDYDPGDKTIEEMTVDFFSMLLSDFLGIEINVEDFETTDEFILNTIYMMIQMSIEEDTGVALEEDITEDNVLDVLVNMYKLTGGLLPGVRDYNLTIKDYQKNSVDFEFFLSFWDDGYEFFTVNGKAIDISKGSFSFPVVSGMNKLEIKTKLIDELGGLSQEYVINVDVTMKANPTTTTTTTTTTTNTAKPTPTGQAAQVYAFVGIATLAMVAALVIASKKKRA